MPKRPNQSLVPTAALALLVGLMPGCADSEPETTDGANTKTQIAATPAFDPDSWPLPEVIPTDNPETLAIGAPAPDFKLPGIDEQMHQLSDFDDAKVLMLVFTCNHCPDAQLAEPSLIKIVEDYQDQSFAMVAISPNNPRGIRPDELGFSIYGDSFSDMQKHAERYGFNFPYLYDGATQATGRAYGAQSSPHCFIFDAQRKLRYTGRVNNLRKASDVVTETPARDAIDALLADEQVQVTTTRSFGCSTKWLSKMGSVAKSEEAWKNKPVTLEPIDGEAVAKLTANNTKKLRLINVWATTCGACIAEMPDLVALNRKFQNRAFEMITISTDPAEQAEEALRILESNQVALGRTAERSLKDEGRTTNNYIWAGGTPDDLAEALDPKWQGPMPYTLLIAPGGEILYRHVGMVDPTELRAAIIDHLGRYWQ